MILFTISNIYISKLNYLIFSRCIIWERGIVVGRQSLVTHTATQGDDVELADTPARPPQPQLSLV